MEIINDFKYYSGMNPNTDPDWRQIIGFIVGALLALAFSYTMCSCATAKEYIYSTDTLIVHKVDTFINTKYKEVYIKKTDTVFTTNTIVLNEKGDVVKEKEYVYVSKDNSTSGVTSDYTYKHDIDSSKNTSTVQKKEVPKKQKMSFFDKFSTFFLTALLLWILWYIFLKCSNRNK